MYLIYSICCFLLNTDMYQLWKLWYKISLIAIHCQLQDNKSEMIVNTIFKIERQNKITYMVIAQPCYLSLIWVFWPVSGCILLNESIVYTVVSPTV